MFRNLFDRCKILGPLNHPNALKAKCCYHPKMFELQVVRRRGCPWIVDEFSTGRVMACPPFGATANTRH